ncbi:hypothetical protein Nepgr_025679 [Nepenthes gracilis]|uniref:Uncharacterized protein n=1 Tax=Nepenthes gracilis TaxID=150966 RepID=A0AAD3Y1S3_NEPGR|nr:hypothetical protein Nepgr_025679 [Nepenthes gracilis]
MPDDGGDAVSVWRCAAFFLLLSGERLGLNDLRSYRSNRSSDKTPWLWSCMLQKKTRMLLRSLSQLSTRV